MTASARSMGLAMRRTAATAPALSVAPSITEASSSFSPSALNTAPLPALKNGESSRMFTAACTASRLVPPSVSTRWPTRTASSSSARTAASCSGVVSSRLIVPAPAWMAMATGASAAGSAVGAAMAASSATVSVSARAVCLMVSRGRCGSGVGQLVEIETRALLAGHDNTAVAPALRDLPGDALAHPVAVTMPVAADLQAFGRAVHAVDGERPAQRSVVPARAAVLAGRGAADGGLDEYRRVPGGAGADLLHCFGQRAEAFLVAAGSEVLLAGPQGRAIVAAARGRPLQCRELGPLVAFLAGDDRLQHPQPGHLVKV